MATYSEDGKWLWDGQEWIPAPKLNNPVFVNTPIQRQIPQQVNANATISVSDSSINGSISQSTQNTENIGFQSLQIQDSVVMGNVVQNTYLTQTVDQEMMNYVMSELQYLRLDIDTLRIGLDSSKKAQIKDKDTVNRIVRLNETIMNAELANGTSILDKKTYEALSTVALAANADGASYMTNSYGLMVQEREEKINLARRKARLAWWCISVASWRKPEGMKNFIEVAEIYLEIGDKRILTLGFNKCCESFTRFGMWATKYLDIPTVRLFCRRWLRKYELKATKDPTIPNWSEYEELLSKAREIYLKVKSVRRTHNH